MKKLILVVDDAKFARRITIRALNDGGYDHIIEAVDAKEAKEQFKQNNPDLVLLDITLPDNSDLTLLKELLTIRPEAKIIIVSAIGQDLIIKDALAVGAKAFLTKPFDEKEFLSKVRSVLE